MLSALVIAMVLFAAANSAFAQATYCNPLDIDYKYNFEEKWRNISYRSGADPVIVNHNGTFYLFETIGEGFWRSKDLRTWEHVRPEGWPERDIVAPAALSAKGKLFLFPSTYERRAIWTVENPESATPRLEVYNDTLPYLPGAQGPWDPAIFHDDDTDKWFMYCGSSNFYPLYGIELDGAKKLNYINKASELIALHPELHGWERFGRDHRDTIKPFIEGAWMTKHGGKYYLQYAAPGTEYNVYANGAYVGVTPMGPFTYAPNNPISYKPGGFVQGAGHGNTFQDNHGNFWNTGTPWIAVNYDFERRIAMFPAGFDKDGLMFASTRFGDFPQRIPTTKWERPEQLFAGWMLLSYRKPVVASSVQYPFAAANVTDENPRTYWLAATNDTGQSIDVDLTRPCEIRAIQINFTDHKSGLFGSSPEVYTDFRLSVSTDTRDWVQLPRLTGKRRDRPNAYIELTAPVTARYVLYEHGHSGSTNLAISDIRIFGKAPGDAPSTPTHIVVQRDGNDPRNAMVAWEDVPGAVGYNVLWGIAPDKLYSVYQVWADQRPRQEIRALTIGQKYSFAVEAFNESGVSKVSEIVSIE